MVLCPAFRPSHPDACLRCGSRPCARQLRKRHNALCLLLGSLASTLLTRAHRAGIIIDYGSHHVNLDAEWHGHEGLALPSTHAIVSSARPQASVCRHHTGVCLPQRCRPATGVLPHPSDAWDVTAKNGAVENVVRNTTIPNCEDCRKECDKHEWCQVSFYFIRANSKNVELLQDDGCHLVKNASFERRFYLGAESCWDCSKSFALQTIPKEVTDNLHNASTVEEFEYLISEGEKVQAGGDWLEPFKKKMQAGRDARAAMENNISAMKKNLNSGQVDLGSLKNLAQELQKDSDNELVQAERLKHRDKTLTFIDRSIDIALGLEDIDTLNATIKLGEEICDAEKNAGSGPAACKEWRVRARRHRLQLGRLREAEAHLRNLTNLTDPFGLSEQQLEALQNSISAASKVLKPNGVHMAEARTKRRDIGKVLRYRAKAREPKCAAPCRTSLPILEGNGTLGSFFRSLANASEEILRSAKPDLIKDVKEQIEWVAELCNTSSTSFTGDTKDTVAALCDVFRDVQAAIEAFQKYNCAGFAAREPCTNSQKLYACRGTCKCLLNPPSDVGCLWVQRCFLYQKGCLRYPNRDVLPCVGDKGCAELCCKSKEVP